MRYTRLVIALFIIVLFGSCKVNQKVNGERVGRWVYTTIVEGNKEVHRGKYRQDGFQKGTWRYKRNGKLYKKEVVKDSIIEITYYYPNHKVESVGQSIYVKKEKGLHYYYTGSWFLYDPKGMLIGVKHYKEGVLEHYTIVRQ